MDPMPPSAIFSSKSYSPTACSTGLDVSITMAKVPACGVQTGVRLAAPRGYKWRVGHPILPCPHDKRAAKNGEEGNFCRPSPSCLARAFGEPPGTTAQVSSGNLCASQLTGEPSTP